MSGVSIPSVFQPATTFPTIASFVNIIVKNVFVLVGVILFLLLIFGGVGFIISAGQGDKEGVGKGKNAITAALIGFLIIFAAYWIVEIIHFITGIEIFSPGI
ncbi:MAG: hypothetical protein V1858_01645 [Candidatus Gottesmanbacteria bacterium]